MNRLFQELGSVLAVRNNALTEKCNSEISVLVLLLNPGRFGPIPVRPGRFGPGRFGPIFEVSRFGPFGAGRFGPIS